MKSYAIGFLGVLGAISLAAAVWYSTQALERPALIWGGTAYSTKAEFSAYLRAKGLSYRTWLARNPGAAPWEPSRATNSTARAEPHDWPLALLLSLNGLLLTILCALVLARRKATTRWQHPIPMPTPEPTPRSRQAVRHGLSAGRAGRALEHLETGTREGARSLAAGASTVFAAARTADYRLQERLDRSNLQNSVLVVYAIAAFLALAIGVLVATTIGR